MSGSLLSTVAHEERKTTQQYAIKHIRLKGAEFANI
jgi:hypothetical protein